MKPSHPKPFKGQNQEKMIYHLCLPAHEIPSFIPPPTCSDSENSGLASQTSWARLKRIFGLPFKHSGLSQNLHRKCRCFGQKMGIFSKESIFYNVYSKCYVSYGAHGTSLSLSLSPSIYIVYIYRLFFTTVFSKNPLYIECIYDDYIHSFATWRSYYP